MGTEAERPAVSGAPGQQVPTLFTLEAGLTSFTGRSVHRIFRLDAVELWVSGCDPGLEAKVGTKPSATVA